MTVYTDEQYQAARETADRLYKRGQMVPSELTATLKSRPLVCDGDDGVNPDEARNNRRAASGRSRGLLKRGSSRRHGL